MPGYVSVEGKTGQGAEWHWVTSAHSTASPEVPQHCWVPRGSGSSQNRAVPGEAPRDEGIYIWGSAVGTRGVALAVWEQGSQGCGALSGQQGYHWNLRGIIALGVVGGVLDGEDLLAFLGR